MVMIRGALPAFGSSNSLRPVPSGAIRPMRLPLASVNHSVPSGAMAMVVGPLLGLGSGNSRESCRRPAEPPRLVPEAVEDRRAGSGPRPPGLYR